MIVDDIVRAELFRLFQFLVINVSRDDAQWREDPKQWIAICPRPPTPITTTVPVRVEMWQRAFDRVIGSQRGIAQWSGLRRTEIAKGLFNA